MSVAFIAFVCVLAGLVKLNVDACIAGEGMSVSVHAGHCLSSLVSIY